MRRPSIGPQRLHQPARAGQPLIRRRGGGCRSSAARCPPAFSSVAASSQHEGDRAHPGRPVRQPDRGQGEAEPSGFLGPRERQPQEGREGRRERRLWEPLAEQREEPNPLPCSWDPGVPNLLPSLASLCSALMLQLKAGGNPSDSHFHPFCAPTHHGTIRYRGCGWGAPTGRGLL